MREYLNNMNDRYIDIVNYFDDNVNIIELCARDWMLSNSFTNYIWCDINPEWINVIEMSDDEFVKTVKLWKWTNVLVVLGYAGRKWLDMLDNEIIKQSELKVESATLDQSIEYMKSKVNYVVIEWTKKYVEWYMKDNKLEIVYNHNWNSEERIYDRVLYILKTNV